MSDSSKLSRLERAVDTLEIKDVLARHCRGLDRGDFDLAASCYHEGATEDQGPFKGTARDFLSVVMPMLRPYEVVARHITTVTVEFDAETALSEAYWIVILREGGAATDLFESGRYLDRFERRNGEWRIAARVAVTDWWALAPRNTLPFPLDLEAKLTKGKHGLDDPFYSVRAAIFGR
jgi:hypothetical protein